MAEQPDELRDEIAARRAAISTTVDQIENRVRPSRVLARRRDRVRRRLTDMADSVLGNDDPVYHDDRGRYDRRQAWVATTTGGYGPAGVQTGYRGGDPEAEWSAGDDASAAGGDDDPSVTDRLRAAGSAVPSREEATHEVRRRTRGNPAAVGLIGFGAGLLLGTILPETDRERRMARQAQPHLDEAAATAAGGGQRIVDDVAEPARQKAGALKDSAAGKAGDLTSEAKGAARSVKDEATS